MLRDEVERSIKAAGADVQVAISLVETKSVALESIRRSLAEQEARSPTFAPVLSPAVRIPFIYKYFHVLTCRAPFFCRTACASRRCSESRSSRA